jgi:hypothetical protein
MMSDRLQNSEEEMLARARADLTRLVALQPELRRAIVDALGDFEFSMADMTPDEATALASRAGAGVEKEDVLAALRCLATLELWRGQDSFKRSLEQQLGIEQVRTVFADLARQATLVSKRIERIQYAELAMPSYRGCVIQYDLRGIPVEERFNLVPIAIVKILLDEGDPITFQCVPAALSALAQYLETGADALKRLEAQVSPTGVVKKE